MVCLFLLLVATSGFNVDSPIYAEWKFDDPTRKAYELVLTSAR